MGFVYETPDGEPAPTDSSAYQRLLMGFVYETTVARMLPTGEGRGYQRLLRGFVYETDDTEIAANSAPGQRRYAGPEGECSAPK
jgi:ribosomal protein L13